MKKFIFIACSLGLISLFSCTKIKHLVPSLDSSEEEHSENRKVAFLKEKLLSFEKPQRIELRSYIKDPRSRFKQDVKDLKQLRPKLDPNAKFYIEMTLFTDETSTTAPLVATLTFLDIETKNLIKEISFNLE